MNAPTPDRLTEALDVLLVEQVVHHPMTPQAEVPMVVYFGTKAQLMLALRAALADRPEPGELDAARQTIIDAAVIWAGTSASHPDLHEYEAALLDAVIEYGQAALREAR